MTELLVVDVDASKMVKVVSAMKLTSVITPALRAEVDKLSLMVIDKWTLDWAVVW